MGTLADSCTADRRWTMQPVAVVVPQYHNHTEPELVATPPVGLASQDLQD